MKDIIKEIVEEINLPKQVLDKTSKFLERICGPSIDQLGEMYADRIRYRRLKNQLKIFSDTMKLLEANNLEPREIKLKNLVPLIESCSLEEEVDLQSKWTQLLANLSTTNENGFEGKVIKVLSVLTPIEAKILDYCYSRLIEYHQKRPSIFTKYSRGPEDSINHCHFWIDILREHFQLTGVTLLMSMENLVEYGLLIRGEPEVEIEEESKEIDVKTRANSKKQFVEVEIELETQVTKSKYYYMTPFSILFLNSCEFENKNSDV